MSLDVKRAGKVARCEGVSDEKEAGREERKRKTAELKERPSARDKTVSE